MSLSEEVIPHMIGLRSSAQIWAALLVAYGVLIEVRLVQLHMQLQNFRRNDLPIASYRQQIKFIADEFSVSRRLVGPKALNASIFNNLAPQYSLMWQNY